LVSLLDDATTEGAPSSHCLQGGNPKPRWRTQCAIGIFRQSDVVGPQLASAREPPSAPGKARRAKKRHRHSLHILEIAPDKVPLSTRERHASQIQKIAEELHQMEVEYHDLNVAANSWRNEERL